MKWAIDQHGAPVIEAAHHAFARAERRLHAEQAPAFGELDVAAFHGHGRLTPVERLAAHRRAFREVVAPCRDALLGVSMPVPDSYHEDSSALVTRGF